LEALEVLALLQSAPGTAWSAKQVSEELRSSRVAAETTLGTLVGHRLVARNQDKFVFSPATAQLAEQTRRALACYKEKRTAVITAIFSAPTPAIRSFAEAFNLKLDKKKDKPDG
jgi:DNA-binding IclR family transcriptional regulator